MIKLSIIIPVYNTEKQIKNCLESVKEQVNENIEVLIINDGSLDSSESIIKETIENYPDMFKYYAKPHTGVADTRNFGIEKAMR